MSEKKINKNDTVVLKIPVSYEEYMSVINSRGIWVGSEHYVHDLGDDYTFITKNKYEERMASTLKKLQKLKIDYEVEIELLKKHIIKLESDTCDCISCKNNREEEED